MTTIPDYVGRELPMRSPEQIAADLSNPQKRALCPNDSGWVECHKGKAQCRTIGTVRRLYVAGLIEKPSHLSHLTPLGLSVRAILQE